MTDLAAQIREQLGLVETDQDLWIAVERFGPDVRNMHAALLAVLDATDPTQLPPNGCDGDGCLALWVRHQIAEKLGIEADDG